jgi:hypothetical protein
VRNCKISMLACDITILDLQIMAYVHLPQAVQPFRTHLVVMQNLCTCNADLITN